MAHRVAEGKFDAFALRCLSAAVLIPLALAAIWAGGIWLSALLLALAVLMAKEWVDICLAGGEGGSPWTASPHPVAVVFMGVIAVASLAATLGHFIPALGIIAAGGVAIAALSGFKRPTEDVILIFGLAYIILPLVAVTWIARDADHGTATLLWVLAVVWVTDIGAYLVGNLIGGPKLAPKISPAKTWSGLLGGLAATAGLAVIAGATGLAPANGRFVILSMIVSLVAQGGDLLESRFKRHFGIKDFGTIIPGHGGVLDRVDGLLIAFPFVACMQVWMGNGEIVWQ